MNLLTMNLRHWNDGIKSVVVSQTGDDYIGIHVGTG